MFLLRRACNSSVGAEQQCLVPLKVGWRLGLFFFSSFKSSHFFSHAQDESLKFPVAALFLFLAVAPLYSRHDDGIMYKVTSFLKNSKNEKQFLR
jgi:hypothetical protein